MSHMQRAGKVSVAPWACGVCTEQRPQAGAGEAYSSGALALLAGSGLPATSSPAFAGLQAAGKAA